MPVPTPWDHAVMAVLFLVIPFVVARKYRRLVARVRSGDLEARASEYRSTIAWQWGLTLALVAGWWLAGRPFPALGFAVPGGWRLAVGAGLTALGLGMLLVQWRMVLALDDTGMAKLRKQMESVVDILPRTPREASLFRALSITAGICEEIVFRGFVIWHLGSFLPLWAAVAIGSVAFGLGHLYQGAAGVLKTGAVGVIFGALYAAGGSLLWPILLHAAVDLQAGAVAGRLLPSGVPEPAPESA